MEIKKATDTKILTAIIIDAAVIVILVKLTIKLIKIEPSLINRTIVGSYYFFFMNLFPTFIFSQSLGKKLIQIKVLNKDNLERLSFIQSLTHCLLLYNLSNQIIVDIKDE